jgi:S1-C subfamily serine protease
MHARAASLCSLALLLPLASPATAQTVTDVFKQVNQAVVVVYTQERTLAGGAPGQFVDVGGLGSGVLISPNGEIMTAAHVVQAAEKVMVEFPTGERIMATVASSFPSADVALLRLEHRPTGVSPVTLGDSDAMEVGDRVMVIGAPLGVSHTLTVGHMSGRRRLNRTMGAVFQADLLQTDAAINQGNSGGPMFNMAGEVVGIVSHIISQTGGSSGLGFVITSNMARELLLEGSAIWSGIEGYQLSAEMGKFFNIPPPGTGLLVQRVAGGSLGEELGLQGGTVQATLGGQELILGGDIIVSVQGIPVGTPEQMEQIQEALKNLTAGQPISVTVLRSGTTMTRTARYTPR